MQRNRPLRLGLWKTRAPVQKLWKHLWTGSRQGSRMIQPRRIRCRTLLLRALRPVLACRVWLKSILKQSEESIPCPPRPTGRPLQPRHPKKPPSAPDPNPRPHPVLAFFHRTQPPRPKNLSLFAAPPSKSSAPTSPAISAASPQRRNP